MMALREEMLAKFQPWVLATYGDSAKTKTITLRKAARVRALLRAGEKAGAGEPAGSEAAKFRVWVKSKGLQLGEDGVGGRRDQGAGGWGDQPIYIPTGTDKHIDGKVKFVFKQVAVVEKFFDIIYSVHVESVGEPQLRGRAGRHCGQKRTYRAVADQYAFLPREAVSRFLLHCTECHRRPAALGPADIKPEPGLAALSPGPDYAAPSLATPPATPPAEPAPPCLLPPGPHQQAAMMQALHAIQSYSLARGFNPALQHQLQQGPDIDMRLPITSTYLRRMRALTSLQDCEPRPAKLARMEGMDAEEAECPPGPWTLARGPPPGAAPHLHQLLQHNGSTLSPGRSDDSIIADDASSTGNKDDDDDDDDDDGNEDGDGCTRDPERLKAFNMFVRLFVDENLDRHVPISKQPKEKIQAIIDSCTRQFPEHSERARKRIRTYLKSCRRTKRSREQAGLDPSCRPTPPHLTSVLAEQLLARACENEADNAKRMRMGMEPVSQPMPVLQPAVEQQSPAAPDQLVTLHMAGAQPAMAAQQPGSPASPFPPRPPGLPAGAQAVFGASPLGLLPTVNGDKKPPLLQHKLSGAEMAAVRQLITGYRESAAFLLRSADELEHLLQMQPRL